MRGRTTRFGTRGLAWAAVAIGAAVLVAGAAGARSHRGGCGDGPPLGMLEGKLARLGVSDATLDAADEVFDAARHRGRALHEETRAAHERMRALLQAEPADREAILAQADALGALQTRAHKARLETLLELRALLTPDQWQSLLERGRGRGRGRP